MRPAYRGKIADFSLIFDQKVFPEAKIWVENFHIYAPGQGVMIPGEIPMLIEGRQVPPGTGRHAHPDFDEQFLFFGSNPNDNLALGGEVEFWLGEGNEAEKFVITKAAGEWIPAGLAHHPHIFRQVDRPFLIVVISMASDYSREGFLHTPLPKGFRI